MNKLKLEAIEWIDAAEVKDTKFNELEHIKPPVMLTYGRVVKEDPHTLYIVVEEKQGDNYWNVEGDVTLIPKCLILYRRELNDNKGVK